MIPAEYREIFPFFLSDPPSIICPICGNIIDKIYVINYKLYILLNYIYLSCKIFTFGSMVHNDNNKD